MTWEGRVYPEKDSEEGMGEDLLIGSSQRPKWLCDLQAEPATQLKKKEKPWVLK